MSKHRVSLPKMMENKILILLTITILAGCSHNFDPKKHAAITVSPINPYELLGGKSPVYYTYLKNEKEDIKFTNTFKSRKDRNETKVIDAGSYHIKQYVHAYYKAEESTKDFGLVTLEAGKCYGFEYDIKPNQMWFFKEPIDPNYPQGFKLLNLKLMSKHLNLVEFECWSWLTEE